MGAYVGIRTCVRCQAEGAKVVIGAGHSFRGHRLAVALS